MAKWTRKQTEMLISLYERHPVLYDAKDHMYTNRKIRDITLQAIATEIRKIRPNTSIADIKSKIRVLRTQYCCEKRSIAESTGASYDYEPKLWCFGLLTFLDNYRFETFRQEPFKVGTIRNEINSNEYIWNETVPSHNENGHYETILNEIIRKEPEKNETIHNENKPKEKIKGNNKTLGKTTAKRKKSTMSPLHKEALLLAKTAVSKLSEKPSNNEGFLKFVEEGLNQIKNPEILNDVKWKMLEVIRDGQKKDKGHFNSFNQNCVYQSQQFPPVRNYVTASPSSSVETNSVQVGIEPDPKLY